MHHESSHLSTNPMASKRDVGLSHVATCDILNSEADLLVNIGFQGSTWFDDKLQIDFKLLIGNKSRMDVDDLDVQGENHGPQDFGFSQDGHADVGLQKKSSSQKTLIIKNFVQHANWKKENEQEKEEEREEGEGVEEEEMDRD
ncbi:hypothetical protein L208DRAFT_1511939 [Tricholoma matsutake]|nr:hypothetical protein L208DRAFT_1511939 [Tricholoma matsutake 945]